MDKNKTDSQFPMVTLKTGCQKRRLITDSICVSISNNNPVLLQARVSLINFDTVPVQVDDLRVIKIPARCTVHEIFGQKRFVNYEVQVEIPGSLIQRVEATVSVPEIIYSFKTAKRSF